jgi:hypothetical protein
MNYEDFNPDCFVSPDELGPWIDALGHGPRPSIALKWWPKRRGAYKIACKVRSYCIYKQTAMGYRLDGNIAEALKWEAQCDGIYQLLPKDVRW